MMNQRQVIPVLLAVYVGFVLYNTFIPFVLDVGWAEALNELRSLSWEGSTSGRTDLIANVVLFWPCGGLVYLFLRARGWRHPILGSLIAGALFSSFIEGSQLFISYRRTAIHDVVCNALGSGSGALGVALFRRAIAPVVLTCTANTLRRQPLVLILVVIALAQITATLLPFKVPMTLADMKHNVRSVNVAPFDNQSVGKLVFNRPTSQDDEPFDLIGFMAYLLLWLPVGYILMLCHGFYWRRRPNGLMWLGLATCAYFPLTEGLQLFIISRVMDVNDVLSGYLGICGGMAMCRLLRVSPPDENPYDPAHLKIPLLLYGVFVVFVLFQPFDWSFAAEARAWNWSWKFLVPFYWYHDALSLWNVPYLIASLVVFLPFSLYGAYDCRRRGASWLHTGVLTSLLGLACGIAIEGLQLLSASRVAEITDVLAYTSSGVTGTLLLAYYEQELRPRAFPTWVMQRS